MTRVAAHGSARVGDRTLSMDLDAAAGEVVGIIGPNGAGKSATLSVLLGLRRLLDGSIRIGEVVVDDGRRASPADARGLAWVPQAPALLPRRRVIDQVVPFSREGQVGASRALASLGMTDLAHVRPAALSGGQRQRVAVARALARADLVLADEPTSAQDAAGTDAVLSALRRHALAGGTVVVVTHDPTVAHLVADHVVVVEELAVTQRGRAMDLAAAPASDWIATNAGASVVTGVVDTSHVLHAAHGTLVVSDRVPAGPARAAIAPTAVALHRTRPTTSSARNVLSGEVVALEPSADGVRVRVSTSPVLVAALTRAAVADLGLQVGTGCWATVKATEIDVRSEPSAR